MSAHPAQAYSAVFVNAAVITADPHALVLMLYDGALSASRQALGHMQAGRIADKGQALSRATRIVDEGLKVSLDTAAGGDLALRLRDLYDYITMRLLQANLRNDHAALAEVIRLLDGLRDAWAAIDPKSAKKTDAGGTRRLAQTA